MNLFSNIKKKLLTYAKIALIAIFSIIYSIRAIINTKLYPDGSGFYELARKWSGLLLKILNVQIKLSGKIPQNSSSYIYVSNHSSMVDIPVLLFALPDNVRIIYKKELEKIPIFGTCLRLSPFISIEREKARNAMSSIDKAVGSVRNGVSVIVFPEGTRSKDGRLGEFKRGAFLLAARSGKPIVPVTIIGAPKILPSGTFELNSGIIEVRIHEQISHQDSMTKADEVGLMANVKSQIDNALNF